MKDIIVTSLLKIYGIIAILKPNLDRIIARSFVESFLRKNFSAKTVSQQLQNFDEILKGYSAIDNLPIEETVLKIGKIINSELPIKQKYLIVIYFQQFIEHVQSGIEVDENETDISITIEQILIETLKIDPKEHSDLKYFISNSFSQIKDKHKILIIQDNEFFTMRGINTMQHKGLDGEFVFYNISKINTYLFKYKGNEKFQIHGKSLYPNHIYLFDKGAAIKGKAFDSIYYSNVVASYLKLAIKTNIQFNVNDVEFYFPKSTNGIHKLSFEGKSGQMLGIMGGSGTGKSTLLNILNGKIIPNKGQVTINGLDINVDKERLKGIIGYIPQDDLLIEELTVYQNLYYNAKLCLENLLVEAFDAKIDKILEELDLTSIKDLKVGNPLNKFISGGQRKRLNIALELIREPYVLFVDEPTSGLSSSDSEKVMELLKQQALSGKYVVVNIHQPSSDIYKLFDSILILDKGGYPVYIGNPIDAIEYVKNEIGIVDASESYCNCCNTVNPEQVLHIIELNEIDEFGEFTLARKVEPKAWYKKFVVKFQNKVKNEQKFDELPVSNLVLPSKIKQFVIFSLRNLRSKLADKQYLFISLLVSPMLALILSFLVRHLEGDSSTSFYYSFIDNENIPAYIFMSIIVALFIGLIVSAEEIFRDKRILQRESFLNLSKFSYYNSKIAFLFVISAIQTFSFVLIGNAMLEVKGMNFSFGIILFSLSCFSNLVGLNISSAFKSAVTIYIIIPLVLVPQILLGGVIVKFDKLQNNIASKENVPFVGDLMASRWAYEAMMVTQFKDNEYGMYFFEIEKQISESSFLMNYTIPRLKQIANGLIDVKSQNKSFKKSDIENSELLLNQIRSIESSYQFVLLKEKVPLSQISVVELKNLVLQFDVLKKKLSKRVSKLMDQKDDIVKSFEVGAFYDLKTEHYNTRVAEFVLNSREINRIKQIGNKLIQIYEPIFQDPKSKVGRAHFFAPVKTIGVFSIDTLWFNVMAIWLMTIVLYFLLIFNILKRLINNKYQLD